MQIKNFVSTEFPENCYAAILNDGIFLVDPGEYTKELSDFITENAEKIKYILLTHNHFDHIMGVFDVKKRCPNAKIVIHTLDAEGLKDPVISLARYFGFEQKAVGPDLLVNDKDILKIGKTKITVLHTPGHSVGSVCYLLDDVIFTGDTLFKQSIGRTDFPGGSYDDMLKSLKMLKELSGDYILYSGHGDKTTLSYERAFNPYLRNL